MCWSFSILLCMLDLSNENVYIVSDTHFNHQKLCHSYPNHFDSHRTYETIEEMNEHIITTWNKTISKNDVVIFLGDFAWGKPFKEIPNIAKNLYDQLNYKGFIWIEGNHDGVLKNSFKNMIPNLKFQYKDGIYLCQHRDFDEESELLKENTDATHLIHGHTHYTNKLSLTTDNLIQNNVCWEAWYRPVHISEIKCINTI